MTDQASADERGNGAGFVRELRVRNFRNYEDAWLPLEEPGVHVLWGANGQGKTSLLEALYYAAFLRSFRTGTLRRLVKSGAAFGEVSVHLATAEGPSNRLFARIGQDAALRWDGRSVERASEFINAFLCVALIPEDIALISGAPAGRRRYLDMLLSQLEGSHLGTLMRYREALRRRNALLRKDAAPDRSAARAFGEILASSGAALMTARQGVCERLDGILKEISVRFTGDERQLVSVAYRPNVPFEDAEKGENSTSKLAGDIDRHWERDQREGCTTTGPHRDDVEFYFGSLPMTTYGSQGERRLTGLASKLASYRLVQDAAKGSRPVVLLIDDVLGDLDSSRRNRLLANVIDAKQIILVQTEAPIPDALPWTPKRVFRIEGGRIQGDGIGS